MATSRTIGSPRAFVAVEEGAAVRGGQGGTDGLEVVAGIEPLGDDDGLAERLAVAQVRRPGEDVDLGAGVVDVIFARRRMAGEGQERGQRIAEHRPAGMPDMHGAGGIGGHVFHVDRRQTRFRATSVIRPRPERGREDAPEHLRLQGDVDEAGAGDLSRRDVRIAREIGGQRHRELAGRLVMRLRLAGVDHGRVDGEVAMGGVARRLDGEPGEVQTVRQGSRRDPGAQQGGDAAAEVGENVHGIGAAAFEGREAAP